MSEPPKPTNGLSSILTTLAGGDLISKLLMVLIVVLSGGGIWNTNREGGLNREEFVKAQTLAQKQIRLLYNNQRTWVVVVKGIKEDDDVMLQHWGLPPSKVPDVKPLPKLDSQGNPEPEEQ